MLDRMIKIFSEIKEDISKDCGHCDLPEIVDVPKGKRQDYDGDNSVFDHIFVDQRNGYLCDDAYGHVYYPVDGKYLKVAFST
jgi:hypothetical protein